MCLYECSCMICLLNRSTIEKAPNWDRVALAHTPNTHVSDNRTKLVPPWGSDYCTSWSPLALFLLFPFIYIDFFFFSSIHQTPDSINCFYNPLTMDKDLSQQPVLAWWHVLESSAFVLIAGTHGI